MKNSIKIYALSIASVLFTAAIVISCSTEIRAQKTLEFNSVLLVYSTPQSVPAGKVWKVESYMPSGAMVSTGVSMSGWGTTTWYARYIKINNNNVWVERVFWADYGQSTQYPQTTNSLDGPMWLPELTTLSASNGVYAISVVEFNVIP